MEGKLACGPDPTLAPELTRVPAVRACGRHKGLVQLQPIVKERDRPQLSAGCSYAVEVTPRCKLFAEEA